MRTMFFLLLASPAAAHTGAHLHPHDGGSWVAAVIALCATGVAAMLAFGRNR
ncbi:hypothetical protein PARPLA_02560 [Rhodobacteraceae bacterium THAF1]|uniref:hypothetical protein n=1 Tax=Palleronia sp. THAF1 TaxID=2587842 RepID=UPI000F3F791E|nr:hypothetical protein [Palleronia sp. THAF1]QFU08040.1 hypothetical protein FIU81_05075 [Palleronia sp. THAF1]VDC27894.1 hypothetical protein PARPLA_02560 [Rhodobacteraceae bacterium THAF1]